MKEKKIRSKKYREYVASQPCMLSGKEPPGFPVHPHHLMMVDGNGIGTKPCDVWCVPIFWELHAEIHNAGREEPLFLLKKITYDDAKEYALSLALSDKNPCNLIKAKAQAELLKNFKIRGLLCQHE